MNHQFLLKVSVVTFLLPFYFLLTLVFPLQRVVGEEGKIRFQEKEDRVEVWFGSELLTQYWWGLDDQGTYYPLKAPGGVALTRAFPMEKREGEDLDHPHHRGLFFGHQDVNGYDFWSAVVTRGKRPSGKQIHRRLATDMESGTMTAWIDWVGDDEKHVLSEERILHFRVLEGDTLVIDMTSKLKAGETPVHFADIKDGSLGIRVPTWLLSSRKPSSGELRNAEGKIGEEVWGKASPWIEVKGVSPDGKPASITFATGKLMLNEQHDLRAPRWHARTYGLLALNPFSEKAYDPTLPEKKIRLNPEESITFQARLILGNGDPHRRNQALSLAW